MQRHQSEISSVLQLDNSDYLMSASKDGQVSLWTTKSGLTKIGALNFKLQAFMDPKDKMSRAKLIFLNFNERTEDDVKIYAASAVNPSDDAEKEEIDEGEGGVLQALFDESEFNEGLKAEAVDPEQSFIENLQAELD